ncbi:MAG: nucleoside monophosphate kinase [Cyanobacteria bacterium SIG28]|nr:nucleoside monophosphate kinase [Cyanobacteria bacterium SIG28]
MKKELIFLGPPACGKGTQTNRLSEYLGLPHIDTGSLLRAEIAKETEEGIIAKSFIDKGQLVPVDLVGKIIAKKLQGAECTKGYVLDGYPRSLEQAQKLEEINSSVDGENQVTFKAIYFDIDTQILLERIIYRQSCPVCGEIYNKKFKPSKVENVCDKCNVELKTRNDDNEEIAKKRFETYFEQTAPLVKFYEDKGVLYKIDANGSIEEVWERLLEVINA